MGRKITETATPEESALESLNALARRHEEFGQSLARVSRRVETEMEGIKVEAEACAAGLDEALADLVDALAAIETERERRMIAEARIGELESRIGRIRLSCDEAFADDDPTLRTSDPDVGSVVDRGGPASTSAPLSEALGITEPVLAALAALTAMEGAASPEETLRILLFRELKKTGLMPEAEPEGRATTACGEGAPTIWS